jgi:hypothetical protein
MVRVLATAAVAAALGCSTPTETAPNDVAALIGTHARVVWVQAQGSDPYANSDTLVLMGLDSQDGAERVLVAERNSYVKPMLTSKGDRVIFSRRPTRPQGPEVFLVNWDGSGLRSIVKGFALAVWPNPADGRDWVYVGTDYKAGEESVFATVTRMPIDDPSVREIVWNKTRVSQDTFQPSPDGRYAASLFPWPIAGVAELPNGAWRKLGEGCWTAMATVRGPLMWYFDGPHRNLTLVDVRTDKRWMVNINHVPGFGDDEVYHPRWTNHPRFLAISGPYNQGGPNQVRSGGAQAEIYIGRFSDDYTKIEQWARVTRNQNGDSFPDVWIDRAKSPHGVAPRGTLGPFDSAQGSAQGKPAVDAGRVVIDGRLAATTPVPTPQSIAPYRNALVVNTYDVVKVIEGTYAGQRILVAEWGIRDRKVVAAPPQPGAVRRLIVERYDAHPELEGERLLRANTPNLPIYLAVTK